MFERKTYKFNIKSTDDLIKSELITFRIIIYRELLPYTVVSTSKLFDPYKVYV